MLSFIIKLFWFNSCQSMVKEKIKAHQDLFRDKRLIKKTL